jgi:hypothetical protein
MKRSSLEWLAAEIGSVARAFLPLESFFAAWPWRKLLQCDDGVPAVRGKRRAASLSSRVRNPGGARAQPV